MRLPYIVMTS